MLKKCVEFNRTLKSLRIEESAYQVFGWKKPEEAKVWHQLLISSICLRHKIGKMRLWAMTAKEKIKEKREKNNKS